MGIGTTAQSLQRLSSGRRDGGLTVVFNCLVDFLQISGNSVENIE